MKKEIVIQRLKERGFRITKQRQILLDVILEENCTSCKEIYYKANKMDAGLGYATVYRMVNLLEEIGAINRNNRYKISWCADCEREEACVIEFEDHTSCALSARKWHEVIAKGLEACGYEGNQRIANIVMEPCGERLHCH